MSYLIQAPSWPLRIPIGLQKPTSEKLSVVSGPTCLGPGSPFATGAAQHNNIGWQGKSALSLVKWVPGQRTMGNCSLDKQRCPVVPELHTFLTKLACAIPASYASLFGVIWHLRFAAEGDTKQHWARQNHLTTPYVHIYVCISHIYIYIYHGCHIHIIYDWFIYTSIYIYTCIYIYIIYIYMSHIYIYIYVYLYVYIYTYRFFWRIIGGVLGSLTHVIVWWTYLHHCQIYVTTQSRVESAD